LERNERANKTGAELADGVPPEFQRRIREQRLSEGLAAQLHLDG
jgi:hypothetical protein